jgi:hypothetical protein
LKELNINEEEIIDIFNEINNNDDDVLNDREERSSVSKMTEQSRNLLNSTGEIDKSLQEEIDFDNLLSLGLKSSEEVNDSGEISDDVIESPLLKMGSGVINDSLNDVQNSEIKFDCSLQFESQQEKQSDLEENLVESKNIESIAKSDQDENLKSKEQQSSNSTNDTKLDNTKESENNNNKDISEQSGNMNNSEQSGNMNNSEQSGNIDNSEQSGNKDISEQSGNIDNSENSGNMENPDVGDTPNDILEEKADFIDMNKDQSMIKLKTKNSNEKKVESKANSSQQV